MAYMKKGLRISFFLVGIVVLFSFCNDVFVPKHKAYPKIIFPTKTYQTFTNGQYPYTFSYPTYAKCLQDSAFIDYKTDNPFWLNVQIDALNATLYLTYKNLRQHQLDKLIYDSYKITNKQVYKATSIQDSAVSSPYGYQIVFYTVTGDAATTHQFFVTDQKKHFLRGSLYLNTTPNEDSLKIVTDFIKPDIIHLLKTVKFND